MLRKRWVCIGVGLLCMHCSNEEPAELGIDESFLDKSVSPCDDFYQFACGTWIKEHAGRTSSIIQRFSEGAGRNFYLMQSILEKDRRSQSYPEDRYYQQLGKYYEDCLLVHDSVELELGQAFPALLSSIDRMDNGARLPQVLAALHAVGVSAFFRAFPALDPADSSKYVLTIEPAGTGLPTRDYYFNPGLLELEKYQEHISALSTRLSATGIDAFGALGVERALAGFLPSVANARNALERHNPLSVETLSALTPHFSWTDYLAATGFAAAREVNLLAPEAVEGFESILSNTDLVRIKSYLKFRAIEAHAADMGTNLAEEENRFHSGLLWGNSGMSSAESICTSEVQDLLGNALALPFVARRFDANKRAAAEGFVHSLKGALTQNLSRVPWLDAETRKLALDKANNMVTLVDAPKDFSDWTIPEFDRAGGHLESRLNLYKAYFQQLPALLGMPAVRTRWFVSPIVTNAFYHPQANGITVTAALLQSPLFEVKKAQAINFGTLGSIIGHEFTHGFDDTGRLYDAQGTLRNWWTDSVAQEFSTRAQCFVDRYNQFEIAPGLSGNGTLTLGENIADSGGLRLAFAAHRASGTRESFIGGYSPDQEFFLAFAQQWCAVATPAWLSRVSRTDPHAVHKFRVNQSVSNSPEFAGAFSCAKGAPMAPANRCELW